MSKTIVGLALLAALGSANPIVEYFISEVQVTPDSLEAVEVHMYTNYRQYPVHLAGWQLTTSAGTATINDDAVLQDSHDCILLNRNNLSGPFSLGDSADSIVLYDPSSGSGDEYRYGHSNWAPPAGASASIYTYWSGIWPYEYLVGAWYIDQTPTMAEPNDDYDGAIGGWVLDRFNHPLRSCWVKVRSSFGSTYGRCDSTGRYRVWPLGGGTYQVSAHSDSTWLPAYYPDSVTIAPNEQRDGINLTIYPVGINDAKAVSAPALLSRGGVLFISVPAEQSAAISVHDELGRSLRRFDLNLQPGKNELLLGTLPAGVYFVTCRTEAANLSRKVVLY